MRNSTFIVTTIIIFIFAIAFNLLLSILIPFIEQQSTTITTINEVMKNDQQE